MVEKVARQAGWLGRRDGSVGGKLRYTSQYSEAKFPELRGLIELLELTKDGMLRCQHVKCTLAPSFQATGCEIMGHISNYHCHDMLGYSTSPSWQSRMEITTSLEEDSFLAQLIDNLLISVDEIKSKRRAHNTQQSQSCLYQRLLKLKEWKLLQDLRCILGLRITELQKAAIQVQSPKLFEIGLGKHDKKLEDAILVLQDINCGTCPDSLEDLVLFTNLSLFMAQILRRNQNPFEYAVTQDDFLILQSCIKDEQDAQIFQRLTTDLWIEDIVLTDWPDASTEPDRKGKSRATDVSDTMTSTADLGCSILSSDHVRLDDCSLQRSAITFLLNERLAENDFDFSQFLNLDEREEI